MSDTATRLQTLRKAKGWNPFQLSVEARIPEQSIRRYEKGLPIGSPETVAALAKALNTTTDFIITGEEPTPSEKAAS